MCAAEVIVAEIPQGAPMHHWSLTEEGRAVVYLTLNCTVPEQEVVAAMADTGHMDR